MQLKVSKWYTVSVNSTWSFVFCQKRGINHDWESSRVLIYQKVCLNFNLQLVVRTTAAHKAGSRICKISRFFNMWNPRPALALEGQTLCDFFARKKKVYLPTRIFSLAIFDSPVAYSEWSRKHLIYTHIKLVKQEETNWIDDFFYIIETVTKVHKYLYRSF